MAAIDNGAAAGFPEMCVPQPNGNEFGHCPTASNPGTWSEGYYDNSCIGFGLVTITQDPEQLILQMADQYGTIHLSYTVPAPTGPSHVGRGASGR